MVKQERKLADISKKADRRDLLRETLEARTRTRKTRRAIEGIIVQMGKRGIDNQDSDGGTGSSGSGARPPEHPPPALPPLPSEPLRGMRIGASETQTAASSHRDVRRRRFDNTKEEPEAHHKNTRPPAVRSFQPTEVPDFDQSRPLPLRGECVREKAPQRHPALAERERNRLQLRLPETFPRSAKQIRDDRKEEERRAGRIQMWTSTIHGLREDVWTQTPPEGLCKVSPI